MWEGPPPGDENDSELLDMLQATHDASLMDQMDRDVSAAASAATASQTTAGGEKQTAQTVEPSPATTAATATAFLVGGSLFSPRSSRPRLSPLTPVFSQCRRGVYRTQRTNLRLLDTRGRFATMSALHLGSLYCPFTHQFVSLSSPHWHHLQSVGFGLDVSIQGGRRVVLVSAGKLYRVACQLQGCAPNFAHTAPPGAALAARSIGLTSASAGSRANTFYRDRCWSPLLERTLGTALERAPVESFSTFYRSITDTLDHETDPMLARSIDLGFVPLERATRWPSKCRAESLAWDRLAPDPLRHEGTTNAFSQPEKATTDVSSTDADHSRLARFGHAFIESATTWRQHVLQRLPKCRAGGTAEGPWEACRCGSRWPASVRVAPLHVAAATSVGAGVESCAPPRLAEWASRVSAAVPMVGLPPQTRAAALIVSSRERSARGWDGEMAAAVWAVVRELQRTLPRSAALFMCPLEHSVDYNTVLDLVAFPVEAEDDSPAPMWLRDPVAMLSLGLEGECAPVRADHVDEGDSPSLPTPPRERVVVVANAHLLSRRAVARLLDQWTRNGAAQRSMTHRRRQNVGSPHSRPGALSSHATKSAVRWRLLLRAEPFTNPTRARYLRPFGSVQSLLISHDFSNHAEGERPLPALSPAPRQEPTNLFHLQEPLSAALLRCGAAAEVAASSGGDGTPRGASAAARSFLVQAICESATQQLPETTVLKQAHTKLSPSGRLMFQETTVPLRSARGQRAFHQACEDAIRLQEQQKSFESAGQGIAGAVAPPFLRSTADLANLLTAYPFLSSVQCRHTLVRSYSLSLTGETGSADRDGLQPAPPPLRRPADGVDGVAVMADAQEMAANTARLNRWLLRMARATAFTMAARRRRSSRDAADPVEEDRGGVPLLEQRYCSFTEPALLLGLWTPTLLFCAPAVADVLPLRHYLLERLREPTGSPARAGTHGEKACDAPLRVADVDIFHVDFVVFPVDRRCRLFGARAILQMPSTPLEDDAAFSGNAEVSLARTSARLHALLKYCASSALFFPLWTYHVLSRRPNSAAPPRAESLPQIGAGERLSSVAGPLDDRLHRGHTFPLSAGQTAHTSTAADFAFSSVAECRHPCPPNLVERRLFSLEAAQHPPLHLIIGTHVVLTRAIRLTAGPDVLVPRGTLCRVVGFVALNQFRRLVGGEKRRASGEKSATCVDAEPVRCARHLHMTLRYMEQQRGATALPTLQPLMPEAAQHQCLPPFVLAPHSDLVGGYRSLHYYALPNLHLPVRLLTGKAGDEALTPTPAFFQNKPSGFPPSSPPPPPRAVCYPVKQLFHPHHADPDALAFLALSAEQRGAAFECLIDSWEGRVAGDATNPFTLVEDLVLSSPSGEAPSRGAAGREGTSPLTHQAPAGAASLSGLPMVLDHRDSPSPPAPGDSSSSPTEAFSCDALTAISLFADVEEE